MRFEKEIRCKGTSNQYYVLKVFFEDRDYPEVHSSKKRAYIDKIKKEYETGIRSGCGGIYIPRR